MISAKLFGFKEEPYFKAEEGATQVPQINANSLTAEYEQVIQQSSSYLRSSAVYKTSGATHRAVITRFSARFDAAGLFVLKEVDKL